MTRSSAVAVIIVLASFLGAQTPPPGGAAAPTGSPRIQCPNPTWNFGTASQQSSITHDFIVKNVGDGPLTITQVIPTCSCTASMPQKTRLEPGEETTISTTLSTQTFQGPITKNITIVSNDTKTPNVVLTIAGEVLPPYLVRPREVVVGKLPKGVDSAESDLEFVITKGADVQVKDIKTSSNFVEVRKVSDPEPQSDGSRIVRFRAKLKAGLSVGLIREAITFVTDVPGIPSTSVTMQASIEGDVQIDPKTFNLGRVKKGTPALKEISIVNTGKTAMAIESASVTPEGPFTVEVVTDEPGRKFRVKVGLKPDAKDGYHKGTLNVQTNCPGETSLQSFFYAYVLK